jgi:homoserine dehydrogenase
MKLATLTGIEPETLRAPAPADRLYVLKFGSSVLRTIDDLPRVAGELYRQRRMGRRIVAVVSALAGETDRLFAEAAAVTGGSACTGVPDLVSLGEERTAALLRIACDRIGLPADICRPEALGLTTAGGAMEGRPARLDPSGLASRLAGTGLVIVPGFVGTDEKGGRTLLGRGGSDFSAIFLAGELGAERVRLYKDVDGVFEADPARCTDARHFDAVSWDDALEVARPLIQPRSVEYAADKRLTIEVGAIGSARPTCVGPVTSGAHPPVRMRPLRIGLAGFGTVGQALAARFRDDERFEIMAILVRDTRRERRVTPSVPPTSDLGRFVATEFDIFVDALSCDGTGAALSATLLSRGVHLVSASKRVIGGRHGRLAQAAAEGGARFLYSAAVGGSAPVLETVSRAAASGRIAEVRGVVNGTVNFILDRVARGVSADAALHEARLAGFAEEACEADLSGEDAAAKLRIIAHRAFGIAPKALDVQVESLDGAALDRIAASGERWVQVARLSQRSGRVEADVRLAPLASVEGLPPLRDEWNGVVVTLADGSVHRCTGRGAGGAATAEAIVADLYDLAFGGEAAAS